MRKNKKGIELALNFIVLLILGMAMLSGAFILATKLFGQAKQSQAAVDQGTQNEIRKLMTDSDSLVVIYPARKTINRKDSATFGVGVQNVKTETQGTSDQFTVEVEFKNAYDRDNNPIEYDSNDERHPKNWYTLGDNTKDIKKSDQYTFPVLIYVPKGTKNGIYIFDASVFDDASGSSRELYDGSKHKIYVKVE